MRAPFLCVLAVCLPAAAMAARQAAPAAALPTELWTHLQDPRFAIVTSIRGLPLGVRTELQRLFGTRDLDIAEPGTAFEAGTADSTLPARRLVAAGCSYVDCLVYYERGGGVRSWRVALFHWTPNETKLEWGGTAPGDLTTIEEVRKAVLSGAIKASTAPW